MKPLVFLDVETGGLDPKTRPVLQCGIVIPKLNKTLNVKCRAGGLKVDPAALEINGLTMDDMEDPNRLTQVQGALAVKDFILEHVGGRAEVVCHNEKFDGAFIQEWFDRVGVPFRDCFHYQWECTLKLFLTLRNRRKINPPNLKLGTLCKYFGIPLENAHDAVADVWATVELYRLYNRFLDSGDFSLLEPGAYERLQEAG